MEWEAGVSRRKLLYPEGINNVVLPCSRENYTRCPMINHNGKEFTKRIRAGKQQAKTFSHYLPKWHSYFLELEIKSMMRWTFYIIPNRQRSFFSKNLYLWELYRNTNLNQQIRKTQSSMQQRMIHSARKWEGSTIHALKRKCGKCLCWTSDGLCWSPGPLTCVWSCCPSSQLSLRN